MNLGGLETLVAFLIVLGVAVLLHEFGHFAAAKLFGVRVLEFAFGFPPKLFTLFVRKGTRYVVCALPIGGYVKLAGMEPGEEYNEPDGFNSKPVWMRMVVYFAGPFMNFVLAAIIFVGIGTLAGVPKDPDNAPALIQAVSAGAPAEKAGFKPGDVVERVNGEPVGQKKVLDRVQASANRQIVVTVRRGNQDVDLSVVPADKSGKGQIGVVLVPQYVYERIGVIPAVAYGATETWRFTHETVVNFGKIFTDRRAREGVGGPVAIARMAGTAFREGVLTFLTFLAVISVNLGVLNLLPLLVVDGGHIALLAVEWVRGRKLAPSLQISIQVVGMVLILLAMALLTVRDIGNWHRGKPF